MNETQISNKYKYVLVVSKRNEHDISYETTDGRINSYMKEN